MGQIRMVLENKINVFKYSKTEFSSKQMGQIRIGLEENLDVSIYAKSEFDWKQMRKTREDLYYY